MKGCACAWVRRALSNSNRERLVTHTAGIPAWSSAPVNPSTPAILLPRAGIKPSTATYRTQGVWCKQGAPRSAGYERNLPFYASVLLFPRVVERGLGRHV